MNFEERFGTDSPLIGMVHLPALPGAPGYGGRREAIRAAALGDARALAEAGFDGLLVENFGDVPVLVGSGVTPDNAAVLLELADGAIVGTAVKRDGVTANRVDPERGRALVEAAVGEEAAGSDAATEPPAENEPEVAGEPEAGGE